MLISVPLASGVSCLAFAFFFSKYSQGRSGCTDLYADGRTEDVFLFSGGGQRALDAFLTLIQAFNHHSQEEKRDEGRAVCAETRGRYSCIHR